MPNSGRATAWPSMAWPPSAWVERPRWPPRAASPRRSASSWSRASSPSAARCQRPFASFAAEAESRVLEATRGADHAIWVVAFLLYAIDAARVLAPREIMLVEASHGRLDAHFGGSPIGGAGRILAVAPLLLPHRGVFVAPWGQARKESAGLAETLRSLQELRRALLVVRLFAAEAFGTL